MPQRTMKTTDRLALLLAALLLALACPAHLTAQPDDLDDDEALEADDVDLDEDLDAEPDDGLDDDEDLDAGLPANTAPPPSRAASRNNGQGADLTKVDLERILGAPIPPLPGIDGDQAEEYNAYRRAARRYVDEVLEYRQDLRATVNHEYEQRRRQVDDLYQSEINQLRDVERIQRNDAIARLENFLRKYPDNDTYTPGLLYRLAVLQYEKADDDFLSSNALHPDFSLSIGYLDRLINEYPDFAQLDGAYFLLGYEFNEMDQGEEARDAFLALVEHFPQSKKAPEAFARIGEYYFSTSQDRVVGLEEGPVLWDRASEYYAAAAAYGPDYGIYDRALYRLAWTEYYTEKYPEMIGHFIDLVQFSDRIPEGSSLRKESIEFMASVLAEEDWNLADDVNTDPDFGMTRFDQYLNTGREYEIEVLRKFADTLATRNRHDKAAEAYQALLLRSPCNPDNPEIHEYYIGQLTLAGRLDEVVAIQSELDAYYAEGSEWYRCQEREGNFQAIETARNLTRNALSDSFRTYQASANKYDEQAEYMRYIAALPDPASRRAALREYLKVPPEDDEAYEIGMMLSSAGCETAGQNMRDEPGRINAWADCLHERAQHAYRESARTTASYLERYPNDPENYLYRYLLADALYRSGQFDEAATQFATVRDINDGRYRRDAANGAIESRYAVVLQRLDEGSVDARVLGGDVILAAYKEGRIGADSVPDYIVNELQKDEHAIDLTDDQATAIAARAAALEAISVDARNDDTPCPYTASEIPPSALDLIEAREQYIAHELDKRLPEGAQPLSPTYAYLNALTYYHHGHFAEARERFYALLEEYPSSPFRTQVAGLIVESSRKTCDPDAVIAETERVQEKLASLGASDAELSAALNDMAGDALFQKANRFFRKNQFEAAAIEYERIVNENPDYDDIHIALYNAGVSYENLKRYDSAMRLYNRLYDEYNETEEAMDALYRVAVNGERFFNFDVAVERYVELHDSERDHPDKVKALRRAAILLKSTERYERAASLFERYHDEHPEQADAPELLFEAARMYRNLGDYNRMAATLERFRDTYERDPAYDARVLESYVIQGDYWRDQGRRSRAEEFYENTLRDYETGGAQSGLPAYYAAKAQFMIADMAFNEWDAISLEGNVRRFKARVDQKKEGSARIADLFNKVIAYNDPEWTMAALFRTGSLYHGFGTTLATAPCPAGLDEFECYGFTDTFVEIALDLKDRARQYYEKVVEFGDSNELSNEWTRRSLNGLNDIDPKKYPIFEGERTALLARSNSPRSLITPEQLARPQDADDLDDDEAPQDAPLDTGSGIGAPPRSDAPTGAPTDGGADAFDDLDDEDK